MSQSLTYQQIEELKAFPTPTVSNAIELFQVRPPTEGFMRPGLECRFPEFEPIVGYAATTTCGAQQPATEPFDMVAYHHAILAQPAPRIAVAQDLDASPIGAPFGEVWSSVHKRLGCVGAITNGGVRDLDEIKELGFQLISGSVMVSHACMHLLDFDVPVEVGQVTIHPGDLIHGDQHGFCIIPEPVAPHLAEACSSIETIERPLLELARSPDFTPEAYSERLAELKANLAAVSEEFSERVKSE